MTQIERKSQVDGGMQPLPAFASFVRRIELTQHKLVLFLYDAQPGDSRRTPLLLVHGLGDEADTWRHVLPALAAQQRVLAVDLPGFSQQQQIIKVLKDIVEAAGRVADLACDRARGDGG